MNVTPLVDVVLVLLIIFMVIIPQMQAGATVSVPGAANPDKTSDPRYPPITVSVTKDGKIFVEKSQIARDQMIALLKEGHTKSPGSKLILKGDRDAPYGLLRAIFKECQTVGFPGVALQVGDLRKEGGG